MSEIPLRRRVYAEIVKDLFGVYYKLYHRLRVEGAEHIRAQGPMFIVINHISALEPFALGVALADRGVLPGIHFWTVSKKELFQVPLIAALISRLGMFPIDRARFDMVAMKTLLNVLRDNKIIAIAPEGTRSPTGKLQAFQPVVAKIAITRRVPILPVGAMGSEQAMPVGAKFPHPKPITIRFGPIFELSEFYNVALTDEVADRASWVMRAHVAELLPEWMREVPPPSGRIGERKK
ncbi:MAG: 1-acyl-sn-glycerol-3-phosphate acyltransferase [Anaerolineales bacterium]|nr:1-acyl-sn-glycerol-3-phosphate acyltransferase [Anaerolineales bacterium]